MNAAIFCRELAARVRKEPNAILIFDRTLAEAGLRRKARGRHAPDITTDEAILLLLAFLSGRPATEAHEAASDLARFTMLPGANEEGLKAFHYAFGRESDLEILCKMPLSDLLATLCRRMAAGSIGNDNFVFLEVRDGSMVELQFEMMGMPPGLTKRGGLRGEVAFFGATHSLSSHFYYETHTATPGLLKWIGEVTAEKQ